MRRLARACQPIGLVIEEQSAVRLAVIHSVLAIELDSVLLAAPLVAREAVYSEIAVLLWQRGEDAHEVGKHHVCLCTGATMHMRMHRA